MMGYDSDLPTYLLHCSLEVQRIGELVRFSVLQTKLIPAKEGTRASNGILCGMKHVGRAVLKNGRKRPYIYYLDRKYFPGLWSTQCKIRKQNLQYSNRYRN